MRKLRVFAGYRNSNGIESDRKSEEEVGWVGRSSVGSSAGGASWSGTVDAEVVESAGGDGADSDAGSEVGYTVEGIPRVD